MGTAWDLCILAVFLLGMTTVAAMRAQTLLATNNAIMMICMPLLDASILSKFGYCTDVGSIYYAALMYGLTLQLNLYGAKAALGEVNTILFALAIVFGSIFLLQEAQVLSPLVETHVRVVGAAFVSFWLMLSWFITLLEHASRQNRLWLVPVITIVMHGLDSAIFFPCAYGGEVPVNELLHLILVGWATKSAITVLSIPFLLWFLWNNNFLRTAGFHGAAMR